MVVVTVCLKCLVVSIKRSFRVMSGFVRGSTITRYDVHSQHV